MNLKLLRSIVKAKDVKLIDYKTSTIESVLFGKRKNQYILEECIKVALTKIEDNKKTLSAYLKKVQNSSNKKVQTLPNKKVQVSSNKKVQKSKEEKLLSYIESNRERELLEYLTERLRTGVINEDLENEIVDAVKKAKAQYNQILHNKESVGKKNMLGANKFVDALPKYIRLFVKNEGVGINNYIKHFKVIDKEFSDLKEW